MRSRHLLIVLAGALAMADAQAALKDQPPEGVKLSGTWKLDPGRSDDPLEALKRAEKAEIAQRQRQIEERTRDRTGTGPLGDDDWGPGDQSHRRDPFPGRRGDGVIFGDGDVDVTWGKPRRSVSSEFLLGLDPNPATLTIVDWGNRVSVSEDRLETDCFAGEATPIADAFGDGERQCGWRGRVWIIETTRVERFKRTDRFELSKDGKELKYLSTASGSTIPTVKVSRTYMLVPASEVKQ